MNNHKRIKQAFGDIKAPGRIADAVLNGSDLFEPIEDGNLYPAQAEYPQKVTRGRIIGTALAVCMLVALVAVPVWVVNGNSLFSGGVPEGTVFAPGMEGTVDESGLDGEDAGLIDDDPDEVVVRLEYDPPSEDPFDWDGPLRQYAWEMLNAYAGGAPPLEDGISSNAFTVTLSGNPGGMGMRSGNTAYTALSSIITALEGTGFCFPAVMDSERYLNCFNIGYIQHPLKSEIVVNEWIDGEYMVREYEVDTDIAAGYYINISSKDNEKNWTVGASLMKGSRNYSDCRLEPIKIEGWEKATAVYYDIDSPLSLVLELITPIPDNMTIPKYDSYPYADTMEPVRAVCYRIYGFDDATLEELIAIAETIR